MERDWEVARLPNEPERLIDFAGRLIERADALGYRPPEPARPAPELATPAYEMLMRVKSMTLTPAQASELERRLETTPEDTNARATLLAYYHAMPQARGRHVLWLIENQPEARVLAVRRLVELEPGSAEHSRAAALWLRQIERFQDNPRVLRNASYFFERSDRGRARALVEQAYKLDPVAATRRIEFYLDGLSANIEHSLDQSTDADLLGALGGHLAGIAIELRTPPANEAEKLRRELKLSAWKDGERAHKLAEQFLTRALELKPGMASWTITLDLLRQPNAASQAR